jgi:FkbM family methyltransferase
MTVIDLGANAGYYTFFASYRTGAAGRVYAFEPFPEAFAQLQTEVSEFKYKNVVTLNYAASDKPSRHTMFVMPGHHPSNSLHPVPGLSEDASMAVEAVRVDDCIGAIKVDVIKIDVEGHELHALRGMQRILAANPDVVVFIEFNLSTLAAARVEPGELVAFLIERGLNLFVIDERSGRLRHARDVHAVMAALPVDGVANMVVARKLPQGLRAL